MSKAFATTSAQDQVLAALGISGIETYDAAQDLFKHIGISVMPVRQGRRSVPSVTILDSVGAAWSGNGDADDFDLRTVHVNLHALAAWVTNPALLPTVASDVTPVVDGAAIQAAHEQEKRDAIDRRYADEQRRKEQRRAHFAQNALLRQHGYTWQKMQGQSDDDDDEWTLFDAGGRVVTVGEALEAIGAQ